MNKEKVGYIAITLVSILSVVGVLMLDPIAQNIGYHVFEDQRTIFGIPNFWNVISNLPFLLVGIMGLRCISYSNVTRFTADIKTAYILFFSGVSLVSFGSGYYHLLPNNESLVWDRLPMTIAFMALFSAIIGEFISFRLGRFVLWPLVVFGVFSVFYWYSTESNGEGDLRLYILVQFLPMTVIPLILLFFKSKFRSTKGYWLLLFAYILAKVFEHFDEAVYEIFILLSGHSLKHVVAALGILFLFKSYSSREKI